MRMLTKTLKNIIIDQLVPAQWVMINDPYKIDGFLGNKNSKFSKK